jgi:FKBP-type peptidyl-prolyl cis-trans isomerase FkpA
MKAILFVVLAAVVLGKLSEETKIKYKVIVHKEGTSNTTPAPGDHVTVHFTGVLSKTGETFHSTKESELPFTFIFGRKMVIHCWEEVVSEMVEGDHMTFTCPHHTAYGEKEIASIPSKSDLTFDLEVLRIAPPS